MPYAAALSTTLETLQALDEVCGRALERLQAPPDLALLFFSPHHAEAAQQLAETAQQRLAARCLLGCGGQAIVGSEQEIETAAALSLWLARWSSRVELQPFHLTAEQTPDGLSLLGWPDGLLSADPARAALLLLADPFTFPVNTFLDRVNEDHPGLRVWGGMASSGRGVGDTRLILAGQALSEGAVGVLLQGPITVRSVVSQGCRPIGQHMVITRAQENLILELGGRPPLLRLQQLWQELNQRDQQLFQQGLHIGRVTNEYQEHFQRGDFLVRNVLGLDRESGALAITENVRAGQTVQFHVRDAQTADEDLHALLQRDVKSHERRPAGALLFTCNGRGTRLFSEPHHDVQTIRAEMGPVPVAGFFAMGELGPVGGQNFIHGFTASVVLFEEA